jgi:hypothetical protein
MDNLHLVGNTDVDVLALVAEMCVHIGTVKATQAKLRDLEQRIGSAIGTETDFIHGNFVMHVHYHETKRRWIVDVQRYPLLEDVFMKGGDA